MAYIIAKAKKEFGDQLFQVSTLLLLKWLSPKNISLYLSSGYQTFFHMINSSSEKEEDVKSITSFGPITDSCKLDSLYLPCTPFFEYKKKLQDIYVPSLIDNIDVTHLYNVIRGDKRTVAIYIDTNKLPINYYRKAIRYASGDKYLLFSDDIDYCKNNLYTLFNDLEVEYVSDLPDHMKLYLMMKCDIHIIDGNLSWWGAFLSNSTEIYYNKKHTSITYPDSYIHVLNNVSIIEKSLGFPLSSLCINLNESPDRRIETIKECNKIGLATEFVFVDKMNDTMIGCMTSHIKCIKIAKEREYKRVLILEDDVLFENLHSLEPFHQDFDILYLGCTALSGFRFSEHMLKLESAHTTHAYILDYKMYDYILENIDKKWDSIPEFFDHKQQEFQYGSHEINKAIDIFYAKWICKRRHDSYCVYPIVAYQRPCFSTIQNKYIDYRGYMDRLNTLIANTSKQPYHK